MRPLPKKFADSRVVERLLISSGLAFDSPSLQQLAVIREFHHLMISIVGHPDMVLTVNAQAMRVAKHALPQDRTNLRFASKTTTGPAFLGRWKT